MQNYTVFLIRHGITEGNLEGKYIGFTDLPLCDEGYSAISRMKQDDIYPERGQSRKRGGCKAQGAGCGTGAAGC